MKINFKKVATVMGSTLMIGATAAMAAAASYPTPFVQNGAADVAIVVGANAALSDTAAASKISANLAEELTSQVGSGTTITGGETAKIEKSSNNLNLDDGFQDVLASGKLDDGDLDFLADGIYKDAEKDEYEYSQAIYLQNLSTTLIADKNYMDKEPTLGIYRDRGAAILSYNITFDDVLNVSTMETSELMIAGQKYYVLTSDSNTTLELLDTADSTILTDGESITVNGREISINYISDTEVQLTVDGETTNSLNEGDTYKLDDGSYVAIKDILYAAKETGISKVEFSIGSGKIVLSNGQEVEVNDENVDDFYVDLKGPGAHALSQIAFRWNVDEETFLTGASGHELISMPVFGNIALAYAGVDFVANPEVTELVSSDDYITLETEVVDGSLSLPILYRNNATSNFTGLGEDSESVLMVNGTTGNSFRVTLNESEDSMFIVSYNKTDEGYTYVYQLSSAGNNSDDELVVKLDNLAGGSDVELVDLNDDKDVSDITLKLISGSDADGTAVIEVSTPVSGATIYGDRIVTAAGLQIQIPSTANGNTTANPVYNLTTLNVIFSEENADGDIALGSSFTATIDSADEDGVDVRSTTVSTEETTNSDFYVGYVFSELATKVEQDKSGDTDTFVVKYNGEEVTVDASVVVGRAEVSDSDANLGTITVLDSETDKMSGKNLIVVGGNCVNSIAAELLGVNSGFANCLSTFSDETGVNSGEALIKSFDRSGNVALLVAGYNAADTEKAVTYLVNNGDEVDTSSANLKVTSLDSATVL